MNYKKKIIDIATAMSKSLSNLVANFADGLHKTNFKDRHVDKKCKQCKIKYKNYKYLAISRLNIIC